MCCNDRLGNYEQHDACQALMAVLKEIENDLPDKEQTSLKFKYDVKESFYDEKYDESRIDDIVVSGVQETGVLNLNANLISKYFDGIQVTQVKCICLYYVFYIFNFFYLFRIFVWNAENIQDYLYHQEF